MGNIEINDANAKIRGRLAGADGEFSGTLSVNSFNNVGRVNVSGGSVFRDYQKAFTKTDLAPGAAGVNKRARFEASLTIPKIDSSDVVLLHFPANIAPGNFIKGTYSDNDVYRLRVYKNGSQVWHGRCSAEANHGLYVTIDGFGHAVGIEQVHVALALPGMAGTNVSIKARLTVGGNGSSNSDLHGIIDGPTGHLTVSLLG